jgi:hypothetical protein
VSENLNEQEIKDIATLIKRSWEDIRFIYPRIADEIIPLSKTGIPARTFYHWKQAELIDYESFEKSYWIRLNIFQYVWLKLIEELRYFGVSLSYIRSIKDFAFSNLLDSLQSDPDLFKNQEGNFQKTPEEQDAFDRSINALRKHGGLPEEFAVIGTRLGAEILSALMRGTQSSLVVVKIEGEMVVDFTSFDSSREIDTLIGSHTNLQIPLKKILDNFFGETGNEKNLLLMGLITREEKMILDAVRLNKYKEIIIKRDGKKKLRIEGIQDKDVIDEQKIKLIKRILGFNEYQEITLTYRNDKHVYLKSKLRLPDPDAPAPF